MQKKLTLQCKSIEKITEHIPNKHKDIESFHNFFVFAFYDRKYDCECSAQQ